MQNPILQQNNIFNILGILKGKDPDQVITQMLRSNPQFRQFYDENKGKSPEQIAREHGLDFNNIKRFI